MATIKKRRATTNGPAKKKKAAPKASAKKYKTIGGQQYGIEGCFATKTVAQKAASSLRAKGKKVRVIPKSKGTGACIYVR